MLYDRYKDLKQKIQSRIDSSRKWSKDRGFQTKGQCIEEDDFKANLRLISEYEALMKDAKNKCGWFSDLSKSSYDSLLNQLKGINDKYAALLLNRPKN